MKEDVTFLLAQVSKESVLGTKGTLLVYRKRQPRTRMYRSTENAESVTWNDLSQENIVPQDIAKSLARPNCFRCPNVLICANEFALVQCSQCQKRFWIVTQKHLLGTPGYYYGVIYHQGPYLGDAVEYYSA